MQYSLTMSEAHARLLHSIIFSMPGLEGAAYLLCGRSITDGESRLLVREVIAVSPDDYLRREPLRLSIDSRSFAGAAKRAAMLKASVIFVHSHPKGIADFSPQDDREEPKLMSFFDARVPGIFHGSLVVSDQHAMTGRVYVDGQWHDMYRVRVLGDRFRFIEQSHDAPRPWFDRQVRAFGNEMQGLLSRLRIGIVGAGGTGSPIAEQLCRLGVGTLILFDEDVLTETNVTRVYGSTLRDAGTNKAQLLAEHLRRIGMGTNVLALDRHITHQDVAKKLRDCDVVFGCTDVHAPRGILVRLALRHLIPVFDVGVKIEASEGKITDITGRVTTLLPGTACLFCRRRISAATIREEQLSETERAAQTREGYAAALPGRDPSVVSFTTAVAAQAVNELLHRLTGLMGSDRQTSEVLVMFHAGKLRPNATPPDAQCVCADSELWGRGDARSFLDMSWTS